MLRIIGGKWRSRKLSFPDINGLRPTGDRLRETLFNWLGPAIVDARCLDAFAGSGVLGFEALSRGAGEAVMIEKDMTAFNQLRHNCDTLGATQAKLMHGNTLDCLHQFTEPFDVIFLDPPFASDYIQVVIDQLDELNLARQIAWMYVETPVKSHYTMPEQWQLWREKHSGAVSCRLWRTD